MLRYHKRSVNRKNFDGSRPRKVSSLPKLIYFQQEPQKKQFLVRTEFWCISTLTPSFIWNFSCTAVPLQLRQCSKTILTRWSGQEPRVDKASTKNVFAVKRSRVRFSATPHFVAISPFIFADTTCVTKKASWKMHRMLIFRTNGLVVGSSPPSPTWLSSETQWFTAIR